MHAVKSWRANRQLIALLSLLLFAMPAAAKVVVDFNPDQDFNKCKTFAFIGGGEKLVALQWVITDIKLDVSTNAN